MVGDGLLPADIDGKTKPKNAAPIPIVGTQDDGGGYGATFDALNIWELDVNWRSTPTRVARAQGAVAGRVVRLDLPVRADRPRLPPAAGHREPRAVLDILSYRQRPTWRLAYRNFGTYESLVTNQSVEALPGVAGIAGTRSGGPAARTTLYQQGTYAPADGVHRWMGAIAQDKKGGMGLGYSVVNGTTVFPGIRYTGRLAGDPLGQMPQGEAASSRLGCPDDDQLPLGRLHLDEHRSDDDCTFWYVNEYYTAAGQASSPAGWQTRVGSFKLPGCAP